MAEQEWSACREQNTITLRLVDGALHLRISHGGVQLPVGLPMQLLTTDGMDLLAGLRPVDAAEREVLESYDLVVGKRIGRHEVRHREQRVAFTREDGGQVTLLLRAAPDGVAVRVVLAGLVGTVVHGADLGVGIPAKSRVWPLTYTPWYEEPRFEAVIDDLPDGGYGLPLLAQLDPSDTERFVLISESDIDGAYGGSYLEHRTGVFSFTLADPVEIEYEQVAVPWRVFHLGTLAQIVTSHLVDDLARPAPGPVPDWVRPGKAAWSWWSDFYSGAQLGAQLRLVAYAAEHGWDHVLVDCGWDRTWMPALVAAASTRGIGIFVWVSWDWLDIHTDLAEWACWGVAGVKVDFMESESQDRYRWYDAVIAEAARVGLMVNFHGSVIPRGWARTHPHVVTYEAVRGAEYYVFYGDPLPPAHNTILPFTRNVIGSADYTPVTFSTPVRKTTEAHELALAVVLESGVTHFADEVSEYLARPLAQRVLDAVPAVWDETRLVGGRPGEWVALARRSARHWFVGVISAGPRRTVDLDLTDLRTDPLQLITDGDDGALRSTTWDTADGPGPLTLGENGGAVLLPIGLESDSLPDAADDAALPPEPVRDLLFADPGEQIEISLASEADAPVHLIVPPGWPAAAPNGADRWTVTVPADLPPAHVAVLTLRSAATAQGRGPLAHVRVVTHPGYGTTDLAHIRPIAAENGFGPVERDMANGGGNPFDGGPITVAGTRAGRGLGVSAPARVSYAVGGLAARFTCQVGIDDASPVPIATVQVRADQTVLATLELRQGEPARQIDLPVLGRTCLSLEVQPNEQTTVSPDVRAHVDWIAPALHR